MPTYKYLDKDGLEHFWGKVDAAKQDKLTAGANISIDANNEISATDTTYSAGTGIDINSGTVSVDTTIIAEKSDIGDATLTIQKNGTTVDSFTANATSNKTINITVPTTAADVNALPSTTKYAASLSLTINSSTYVVTGQLKDQDGNNLGTAQTIDLPLESVVVNGSYDSATKEVVLTLQNGNTVRFSVADLVSGLQTEITSANPLDADLVDDSTSTNKFVTSSDISTWNAKQDALTAGSNVQINGTTISATDTTYSAGTNINIVSDTISTQTRGIEYIVGTQASATNLWTGVSTDNGCSSGTMYVGKTIAYYLSQAGNSSAATLNLTLPDGTTTGAIAVRRQATSTVGTAFAAGNVIVMIYDGTYWKVSAYYDSNTNYQMRFVNYVIKAAENIPTNCLICGTSSGYKKLGSGSTFDITYPLLWNGNSSSWSAGNSSNNVYSVIEDRDLQQNKSGWTGTANLLTYLVGTLSGTTFTVDSAIFTQTVPTTDDGKVYAPIGLTRDTNRVCFISPTEYWAYKNGEFRPISHPESDPIFSASAASGITSSDISDWNDKQDALTAGSNIQINGTTISATDTTYSDFVGASSSVAGSAGLVPAPAAGDDTKFLSGDGIWKTVSQYALPIATANDLGGIKVGNRLTINSTTGVLSADSQTDNNFTTALKDKLDGIASGAEVNVQANWTEADSSSDAYIQNKPSLATVATSGNYNDLTNKPTIPAAQVNSDWDANSGVAQILNKPSLATVATSGSYADLTNKPTIPTVNDATLTIQKNGTSVGTFTANASSNVTANITVPTKTSDITNDSGFISNVDVQEMAVGQGSTNPVFDGMTPIQSFEWDVSDTTYRPIYQMDNTGWTYDNMDVIVAYRITVTGTGISAVTDVVDRWFSPASWPITSLVNRTLSTSNATCGIRYLRAVYPVSGYVNNNTYKLGQEIVQYNSTNRHYKIDVFKTNSKVIWNTTKPAGTIYQGSTYQNNNGMTIQSNRGWVFRAPAAFNATSSDAATRVSSYESATIGSSSIKTGASALSAGHFAYLATDGLVYDLSNTTNSLIKNENAKIGYVSNNINANSAIDARYLRQLCNLSSTNLSTLPHDTITLGVPLFLRCTMDASGNIHSDNYIATSMTPGYTWVPFGVGTGSDQAYMDIRKPTFYTINANGNLTHINGEKLDSPEITVTGTDPGEGVALGQNEFIAVYGAPDYSDMIDVFYPVGSYYETSDTTFNPNTAWLGTTWVEDTAGQVLVAQDSGTFATVGDTGGEETHTLTIDEMPSHHHTIVPLANFNGSRPEGHTTGWEKSNAATQDTSSTGGSQAHNNLQPYTVIKRWHRTS